MEEFAATPARTIPHPISCRWCSSRIYSEITIPAAIIFIHKPKHALLPGNLIHALVIKRVPPFGKEQQPSSYFRGVSEVFQLGFRYDPSN
ncbi:hypothetical protein JCM33374_g6232 [Metschnikowia sp. JCM 33374]|nr:hypothetical protein JCM33374_g6232 [Metschnikowia sp. JCM 33374]